MGKILGNVEETSAHNRVACMVIRQALVWYGKSYTEYRKFLLPQYGIRPVQTWRLWYINDHYNSEILAW